MRLICPNCGAQYEVPDGVIPEQGRDVQCSNCGNTWFQPHPDQDPDLAEELGQDSTDMPAPPPAPEAENPPFEAEDDADEDRDADDYDDDAGDDDYDDDADDNDTGDDLDDDAQDDAPDENHPAPPPAAPSRRNLDPSIAELLREEAEFEARQRASESLSGLETQPDLGLEEPAQDEAARRAQEARRRMASRQGLDDDHDHAHDDLTEDDSDLTDHVGSRRELLPDIEEINSSLNADARRPARADDHLPGAAALTPRPSGFRRGFALGLLLVVFLWALYAFGPQIAQKLPQIAAPLKAYSQTVDTGRLWLDDQAKALLVKLDAMAAASEK